MAASDAFTPQTVDEVEVTLGGGVKTLRIHRNMDQKSLAERAGISVRTLWNFETGGVSSL